MALVKCPECGQEISDKAKKCIHCGKILIDGITPTKSCNECGKVVPANTQECPYCGYPLNKKSKRTKQKVLYLISVLLIICITIFVLSVLSVKNNAKKDNERIQNVYETLNSAVDTEKVVLDYIYAAWNFNVQGDVDTFKAYPYLVGYQDLMGIDTEELSELYGLLDEFYKVREDSKTDISMKTEFAFYQKIEDSLENDCVTPTVSYCDSLGYYDDIQAYITESEATIKEINNKNENYKDIEEYFLLERV